MKTINDKRQGDTGTSTAQVLDEIFRLQTGNNTYKKRTLLPNGNKVFGISPAMFREESKRRCNALSQAHLLDGDLQ